MIEAENWVSIVKNHPSRNLLFLKETIILKIDTGTDSFFLIISKENTELKKEFPGKETCLLTGDEKIIQCILRGEIKLQDAIYMQQVQVKSSFRTILLLESIFWLNRKDLSKSE
ncbi:hypothetical protein OEV98_04700 [Caldibacillus lycopersici]|uniref:SCP2 domain-containing protein n=1 Tax=Perspicuibacillus lycopersici TaxID=1325689 RepID=A0AAE3IR10_9BACI|nr:hypothetical protein [Perspicuibacillus lycopersici]MCU9612847.1 hypothetical protein [Perspicuibacillus lycopersici]